MIQSTPRALIPHCLNYMKSLSVLVADHHPLFAEGIRAVLSAPANQMLCTVTAVARNAEQVEGYLKETRADLILLDPLLPVFNDIDLLSGLKSRYAGLRVLLFSQQNDPKMIQSAFNKGADGYLLKTASKDELRNAILEVSEGRRYIGRGVNNTDPQADTGGQQVSDSEISFAKKYQLTRREMEIVRHIGQALTNKEIGDRLFISDQTVSVHRKNIMRKLRVNSTATLIKMVFEYQMPAANY